MSEWSILLLNCLNDFCTASARNKYCDYCSSNGHVRVNLLSEKKKWLKLHNSHYQFKVLFILYADFESLLKLVGKKYREKMNQMKTGRKTKTLDTEI